jgi:hypothetical protein
VADCGIAITLVWQLSRMEAPFGPTKRYDIRAVLGLPFC